MPKFFKYLVPAIVAVLSLTGSDMWYFDYRTLPWDMQMIFNEGAKAGLNSMVGYQYGRNPNAWQDKVPDENEDVFTKGAATGVQASRYLFDLGVGPKEFVGAALWVVKSDTFQLTSWIRDRGEPLMPFRYVGLMMVHLRGQNEWRYPTDVD